jgi:hypothetical protein
MSGLEIDPGVVDKIRKSMTNVINAYVSFDVTGFMTKNSDVRKVIGGMNNRFVTIIMGYKDAIMVPLMIRRKRQLNVRQLYDYPSEYVNAWIRLYLGDVPNSLIEELRKKAIIHIPYYDFDVYVYDIMNKETRDYLMRLAIFNYMVDKLWDMYRRLWDDNVMTLSKAYSLFKEHVFSNCQETTGAFNCLIRNAVVAPRKLRDVMYSVMNSKIAWLKRKIELNNLVAKMVGKYVKSIRKVYTDDPHLSYISKTRAVRYLDRYDSYVDYDHKEGIVRYIIRYEGDVILPLLAGFEENEKFVRIKLDLIRYNRHLMFNSYGSWIIGVDKLTDQSFSIALPYQCVSIPMHVCVDYIYGLRDEFLRKNHVDVEIYEV